MNVGELKCEKVPNLYFVQCSKKLDELLAVCEQDRCVLGYPALERHMNMEPAKDQAEKNKWFGEFIRYKESKKLFANSRGQFSDIQRRRQAEVFHEVQHGLIRPLRGITWSRSMR